MQRRINPIAEVSVIIRDIIIRDIIIRDKQNLGLASESYEAKAVAGVAGIVFDVLCR